jgi:redox-sensitive bicupin YhaK (pirin superfamily)
MSAENITSNNMHLRKSAERGYASRSWLESYHSFSFASYYDPAHMAYSVLRVINEDVIAPAQGFGMHPHENMEIITYMLQGELQHQDSLGNGSIIKAGDVQRMTAGTGIVHSEVNASTTQSAHLLQIWIIPERNQLAPSYEEKNFAPGQKQDRWCLIAAGDGRDGALHIHQDISLYATILSANSMVSYSLQAQRSAYIQVASGTVQINDQVLVAGDALMLDTATELNVRASVAAELLLFDLPANN